MADDREYRFSTIRFAINRISVLPSGFLSVLYTHRHFGGVEEGDLLRPGEDEPGGSSSPSLALGFLVGTTLLDVVKIPGIWFCLPFNR